VKNTGVLMYFKSSSQGLEAIKEVSANGHHDIVKALISAGVYLKGYTESILMIKIVSPNDMIKFKKISIVMHHFGH